MVSSGGVEPIGLPRVPLGTSGEGVMAEPWLRSLNLEVRT